jgi:predicted GTPase
VPIIPISAKTKTNVEKIVQKVLEIHKESDKTVSKRALDDVTKTLKDPPGGEILKLRQVGRRPPIFRATLTSTVKESYIKYLRNTIRNYFGFAGIPILIKTSITKRYRNK